MTCEYRHFRGAGHHVFGETPRRRADFLAMKAKVLAKHARELAPERLARGGGHPPRRAGGRRASAAATARRELAAARAAPRRRRARAAPPLARGRFHRLNGEAVALRTDGERLRAEAQRLYDAERELRAAVADQDAHLGRTYAEIERLNALVREMEGTRAWRLHRWLTRRKRG